MSEARIVHLMRHGETATPGRFIGRTDSPATAEGIAACARAAIDGPEIAVVVSSDLSRARACATAAAAALGLPVSVDARWRELDFGEWDGHTTGALDGEALARFWDDPDKAPPPGGERWSALVARVGAALVGLPDRALVVSHAGAMRAALAAGCGLDARQAWIVELPCAAILSLRLWPGPTPMAQIIGLKA